MPKEIILLLLMVLASFVIARINKNAKYFGILMLAAAFGFVVGATVRKLQSDVENQNVVAVLDAIENGLNNPTLQLLASPVVEENLMCQSGVMGNDCIISDILLHDTTTAYFARNLYPRCMSPPMTNWFNTS